MWLAYTRLQDSRRLLVGIYRLKSENTTYPQNMNRQERTAIPTLKPRTARQPTTNQLEPSCLGTIAPVSSRCAPAERKCAALLSIGMDSVESPCLSFAHLRRVLPHDLASVISLPLSCTAPNPSARAWKLDGHVRREHHPGKPR